MDLLDFAHLNEATVLGSISSNAVAKVSIVLPSSITKLNLALPDMTNP